MSHKKKILFCTESSHIASGYGSYTKNILEHLHKTGKYDIAELSCYRTCDTPYTESWKIYPNEVTKSDPRYATYTSQTSNQFGHWRFDACCMDFKPDIVIDFRDIFMTTHECVSILRSNFHLILAPTLDSFPVKPEWVNNLRNADTVLTHTNWAKKQLEEIYNIKVDGVVHDAVDHQVFRKKNQHKARMEYQVPADAIIIGSVMRNQRRKIIPELLDVLNHIKTKKNLFLHLHTSYPESQGWNLPLLLQQKNLMHKVLFTYICRKCKHIQIHPWQKICSVCHRCRSSSFLANVNNAPTPEQLSNIYNMYDAYIQYSICEGFGLPPLEAASCGVPVITMDNGAMKELGEKINANLVETPFAFTSLGHHAYRFYPDKQKTIDAINKLIHMDLQEKLALSETMVNKSQSHYSWEKTGKTFENVIDSIQLNKTWKKIKPSYFKQLNTQVPQNLNNRNFIYYIIDNILHEPWLKYTYFIQKMIEGLNYGAVADDSGKYVPYTQDNAKTVMQVMLNNKKLLYSLDYTNRIGIDFDFLSYK